MRATFGARLIPVGETGAGGGGGAAVREGVGATPKDGADVVNKRAEKALPGLLIKR